MRALLSVWDKTGLVDLARGLEKLQCDLIASGGTAAALREAGIAHRDVADVTQSPEMLGGRVKTLHPKIHGGILADRSKSEHLADLVANDIVPIDVVVSNLYPFDREPSVEMIDIGGPTMVRAAAKNFEHVTIVTSPTQYDALLDELDRLGAVSAATRYELARAAFAHVATYDAAIVAWFDREASPTETEHPAFTLPATLHLSLERAAGTRYGENPHQVGARYRLAGTHPFWDEVQQHAGTELSYLNFFDTDAAWRLVHELSSDARHAAAVAIIKHANASGAALGDSLAEAYQKALAADPMSAFGGVVAIGGDVDDAFATVIATGPQADVIIATSFTPGAVDTLVARRKTTRVLSAPSPEPLTLSVRTFGNTVLVQNADELLCAPESWRCVTTMQPTPAQLIDLTVAWRVCARTTSNAIVIANGGVAVGVGAGQQSRVVASQVATAKAGDNAVGAAAASDAFFPFADGLDALTAAGITSVVQPGGSVKDQEIIDAANDAGVVMMLTGERHFRH